jgi:predicted transposase/invertase (TIGR01784 family)
MNDAERVAYDRYCDQLRYEASMYESTYITGKAEGKVEGNAEGKAEVGEVMVKNGETDEKIMRYTGLSVEEVKALRMRLGL